MIKRFINWINFN